MMGVFPVDGRYYKRTLETPCEKHVQTVQEEALYSSSSCYLSGKRGMAKKKWR